MAIGAVEKVAFGTSHFASFLQDHFLGGPITGDSGGGMSMDMLGEDPWGRFLLDPGLYVGLAVTAVTVPAYYLTLITWLFIAWVDYYLDVGIVTDKRIIDIDQRGLFRRNVAELDCKMVQDINADKTGILQTLFNFGDVIVQTAGETPNFSFHAVPRPELMVDRIQDVVRSSSEKEDGTAEKLQQAASKMEEAAGKISENRPDVQAAAGHAAGHAGGHAGERGPEPRSDDPGEPAGDQRSDETPQDLPRQYER